MKAGHLITPEHDNGMFGLYLSGLEKRKREGRVQVSGFLPSDVPNQSELKCQFETVLRVLVDLVLPRTKLFRHLVFFRVGDHALQFLHYKCS